MDIIYTQYGDRAALEANGPAEEIASIVSALNRRTVIINVTSAGDSADSIATKIADILRREARGAQGSCE